MITIENTITYNTVSLKSELTYNGITLLTYRIDYPEFKSEFYQIPLSKINMSYKTKALKYQKYLETELLNMAVEQYNFDIENNFPIRAFEAILTFEITYSTYCIISLYFDKYEFTGGAHGMTVRESQTFNLQKGYMISLSQLINCLPDYKTYILSEVVRQIEQDPSIYFEDYNKLIVESFYKNSFYCSSQGIVVYYQHYDIAPYSSGIREFFIPYSDCVLDPKKLCYLIK